MSRKPSHKDLTTLGGRIQKQNQEIDQVFQNARDEVDRGYAHSLMTGTLFPVSPLPKSQNSYTVERRGDARYILMAGTDARTNEVLMPYGIYPRLIMCWVAEQIRKAPNGATDTFDPQTRRVTIPSITRMMRELRIRGGGTSRRRFMEQLYGVLTSSIIMVTDIGGEDNPHEQHSEPIPMATKITVPRPENPSSYSKSSFVLNEAVYQVFAKNSMPYVKAVMEHLVSKGGSVMRFDLYLWLSDTAPNISAPLSNKWDYLHQTFGRNYTHEKDFRVNFVKALREIEKVYPSLRYEVSDWGLLVFPSPKQLRPNGTVNIESAK